MQVTIETSIKQWLGINFHNWTHGIFMYTPKFYIQFECDTMEEVNAIIRKLPKNMYFRLNIQSEEGTLVKTEEE